MEKETKVLSLIDRGFMQLASGQVGIIAICVNLGKTEIWSPDYFEERTGLFLFEEMMRFCYIEQDSFQLDSNFEIKFLPTEKT